MHSFLSSVLRSCTPASSSVSLALILTLGLGTAGCQDKASAPPEPSTPPPASVASNPEKTPVPAPAAAANPATTALPDAAAAASPEVMVIKKMDVGDRACYVELENAQGERSDEMASFEMCEQEKLLGQRVYLKREPAAIMAMSCEGNPECTQTETVNLIVAAEKSP